MQSASDQPPVLLQRDGPVVRLTINRPSADNRLDNATTRALLAHVETLAADHRTRAVILTAAGETFSAGADLSVLQDGAADAVGTWLRWGHRLTDAIAALPQPTLTAINGLAAGAGFELALATDLRLLARDARIGLPQVRQGMIPAWGGTQRLARLVGPGIAKELIYTGRLVRAEEAPVPRSRERRSSRLRAFGRRAVARPAVGRAASRSHCRREGGHQLRAGPGPRYGQPDRNGRVRAPVRRIPISSLTSA